MTATDTGDDCIAIKSGRNNDGRRLNTPTENVIIRNCTMKDGHGGITVGSEISGGVRNVVAIDNKVDSPDLWTAIRFKNNAFVAVSLRILLQEQHNRDSFTGRDRDRLHCRRGCKGRLIPLVPMYRSMA
ncbi:MAG: hypothetical protein IPG58_16585 [Acidobacteria bacterium]|nr:hypothetical protein [Acidobacteriota bacterium]